MISIVNNDDYNHIYSIDEAKEEWSNDGDYKVKVDRKRIVIC